jgi:hypothetical protein
MSQREAPPWLVELQERFGATIRTPLDRSTGTLRAVTAGYPACTDTLPTPRRTAEERLAVYNRQYWFRLFTVVQGEFPLSARLLGYWPFNGLIQGFLLRRPPRGFDIGAVADGFAAWLQGEEVASGQDLPGEAFREAVSLDEAWRCLFRAPEQPPFRPSAADAARLMTGRLEPRSGWALHRERWPLVELRQALLASPPDHERPVPLPSPHEAPRCWLLVHRPEGHARLSLAPRHARLLELLREGPVGEALARLEGECPPEDHATLPGAVQRWLAHSVEQGLWRGLTSPSR